MDSVGDEEELLAKHRKQRKELQAEIQKLKKSVGKGDKKRKKEVTEEITKLESDLKSQQENELADFKASNNQVEEDDVVSNDTTALAVGESENGVGDEEEQESSLYQVRKKSKAQIRREKQQAKDREQDQRIKDQEVKNRQGPRHKEMLAVAKMLKDMGLSLHEIPADGDCMYTAIGHQLACRDIDITCDELRLKAADYMREHPDDFLPFLIHPQTDSTMTPEQFSEYCDKMTKPAMWGGHIELRALSQALELPIQVLQADVQPLHVGEDKSGSPLTLVYHRHAYRLGEHYNSVRPRKGDKDDDEDGDEDKQDSSGDESIEQKGAD